MKLEGLFNKQADLCNTKSPPTSQPNEFVDLFCSPTTHTHSVFSINNQNANSYILANWHQYYVNNGIWLNAIKRHFLSKITKQTYFDTKITVDKYYETTPVGAIAAKSFFKSERIAANIACILNGLKHFDRLTTNGARLCVGIFLF